MLLMSLLWGPLWKAEAHDAADAAGVMMLLMQSLCGILWKAAGS